MYPCINKTIIIKPTRNETELKPRFIKAGWTLMLVPINKRVNFGCADY